MAENLFIREYLEEVLPRDGYAGLRLYCDGGTYCWCRVGNLRELCKHGMREPLSYCELATEAEIAALETQAAATTQGKEG